MEEVSGEDVEMRRCIELTRLIEIMVIASPISILGPFEYVSHRLYYENAM